MASQAPGYKGTSSNVEASLARGTRTCGRGETFLGERHSNSCFPEPGGEIIIAERHGHIITMCAP